MSIRKRTTILRRAMPRVRSLLTAVPVLATIAVGSLAMCPHIGVSSALAQGGTAFLYTGSLRTPTGPYSGLAEFRFSLFNRPFGGELVGSPSTLLFSEINVIDGVFNISLDFGANAFNGDARFLQIDVRTPQSGPEFITLSPRSPVGASPVAIFALRSASSTPGPVGPPGPAGPAGPEGAAGASPFTLVGGNASFGTGALLLGATSAAANTRMRLVPALPSAGGSTLVSESPSITDGTASAFGVVGTTSATAPFATSAGVFGQSTAAFGPAHGVLGRVSSAAGNAVRGESSATSGVAIAIAGSASSNALGAFAISGRNTVTGVNGAAGGYGDLFTPNSAGVSPLLTGPVGIAGSTANTTFGAGVLGVAEINGSSSSSTIDRPTFGVVGLSRGNDRTIAVAGYDSSSTGSLNFRAAVYGETRADPVSSPNVYAGYFKGKTAVVGSLSKSGGSFKIDHPLDPANKYLYHSFVESPDMLNIYSGVVRTDDRGFATVTLPSYFEALNTDYRYQLTIIDESGSDEFIQAKVVSKVKNGQFVLRTSSPSTEVSWQVTGIRNDAWARANRIVPEVDKVGSAKGTYLHPELFGAAVTPPDQRAGLGEEVKP
ncbi:MAG: hypothetical protein ACK5ZN_12395 [Phycisphaerales bacterium]